MKEDSLLVLKDMLENYLDSELDCFANQTRILAKGFLAIDVPIFQKSKKISKLLCESLNLNQGEFKYLKSYQTPEVNFFTINSYRKPFLYIFHDDEVLVEFYEQSSGRRFKKNFFADYLFHTITQGIGVVIPKMYQEVFSEKPNINSLFDLKITITGGKNRKEIEKFIELDSRQNSPYVFLSPAKLFESLLSSKGKNNLAIIKDRLKLWDINPESLSKSKIAEIVKNLPFNDFKKKDLVLLKKISNQFYQSISNDFLLSGLCGEDYYAYKRTKSFQNKIRKLLSS